MDAVLLYLLQSSAILGASYILFFILFRRETNYKVNRIYLLVSAVLSLLIPFAKFKSEVISTGKEISVWLPLTGSTNRPVYNPVPAFDFTEMALKLYLIVCIVLFTRFVFKLIGIFYTIKKNKTGQVEKNGNIIINGNTAPFSFFNFIFLPDGNIEQTDLDYILAHELVHIKKYHTVDKLFAELIIIMQWFNPFAYLFKRELTAQHELLADSEMILRGADVYEYMNSLFEYSVLSTGSSLSNSYNSLLKRRLERIQNIPNVNIPFLKSVITVIFVVFVLAATGIINGCLSENLVGSQPVKTAEVIPNKNESENKVSVPVEIKKLKKQAKPAVEISKTDNNKTYTFVKKMPQYPGGDKALISYIYDNLKYPEIAKRAGVEGRVIASFVVNSNGKVEDVKIVKGLGAGCDEVVTELLGEMPNWKPGEQDGNPVAVRMSVPINFKLSQNKLSEL